MSRTRLIAAVAILSGLMAVSAAAEPRSRPTVKLLEGARCSYSPADRVLEVTIKRAERVIEGGPPRESGSVFVGRWGRELAVLGGIAPEPIRCKGGTPTVANTDTIHVDKARNVGSSMLYLSEEQGPLGPGATDEGDGSSEIEIALELNRSYGLFLILPDAPDTVTFGSVGRSTGVNLNAEEAMPDVDLAAPTPPSLVRVLAWGGADSIDATGEVPPYDGPLRRGPIRGAGLLVEGGGGPDVVRGTPLIDFLVGGDGRDVLEAGGGGDFIEARDGARDVVDCGAGRDRELRFDPNDALLDCEPRRSG